MHLLVRFSPSLLQHAVADCSPEFVGAEEEQPPFVVVLGGEGHRKVHVRDREDELNPVIYFADAKDHRRRRHHQRPTSPPPVTAGNDRRPSDLRSVSQIDSTPTNRVAPRYQSINSLLNSQAHSQQSTVQSVVNGQSTVKLIIRFLN